jgi:hypothetical protein
VSEQGPVAPLVKMGPNIRDISLADKLLAPPIEMYGHF